MKLILCPHCHDIVKLVLNVQRGCECERSWGLYEDDLNVVYGGDAIPLGFDNRTLLRAIKRQPPSGLGYRFEAFVIPRECPTFKREKERESLMCDDHYYLDVKFPKLPKINWGASLIATAILWIIYLILL